MSSKPNNLIVSSDFATLKNDPLAIPATLTVPGNVFIPGFGVVEWHTDVSAGSTGSSVRCRIRSSKNAGKWSVGTQLQLLRTSPAGPYPYQVIAYVYVLSPGVLRCGAAILNPYSFTMQTELTNEVIDFSISTFLPPFI